MRLALTVNGQRRSIACPPMKRLIDVLREDLGLTGTKEGCGEGECGACTVLLDGAAVNACLIPVGQVGGGRVETVESLGRPGRLAPLQEAFLENGAAQCGICTPGMLMAAAAYVRAGGRASDAAIRTALAGNLCRCTGYAHIVRAVARAARSRRVRPPR
ncbi:MAG TPA: (2Fe-2S)-binding protein [Vicinamibacteria bacterium]|nr:(2Fe-2S)-binding protein [Vicinamibacteria bacterium]